MVNSLPGPQHCRWSTVESGEVTVKEGGGKERRGRRGGGGEGERMEGGGESKENCECQLRKGEREEVVEGEGQGRRVLHRWDTIFRTGDWNIFLTAVIV